MVDVAKRDLVDNLLGKKLSYYIQGCSCPLWIENPEEFKKRIDELDRALVPGFGFGGHKISARYDLSQAELALKRAKIEVIRAAALPEKSKEERVVYRAAMKIAKAMMRAAADRMSHAIAVAVYHGEI